MNQISPPIRIVLIAVIGLVAVYMLFLRPKAEVAAPVAATPAATTPVPAKDPGAKTNSKPGAIVQSAITKTTSASEQAKVAAGEAPGGLAADTGNGAAATGAATTGTASAPGVPATAATPTSPVTKETLAQLPKDIRGAVAKHKVLVLLFYNNRSADDRAVRRALSHVNTYGGQVSVAPHWIKTVARYQAITRGVDVEQSPTIVVADRNLKADTLVGYVDRETINQAVVDAIRASGGSLITDPYFRKLDAICASAKQEATAIAQPASAAAVPAYLASLQAISVAADVKAADVKAPKKHARFDRRFNKANAASTVQLTQAMNKAKANPAASVKIAKAADARITKLEKKFVRANGAHGLSCF
jgi:hypothetical protein